MMEKNMISPPPERRYRSLFENAPELIIFQNAEGIILDANPAFLKMVKESKENVIKRSYYDFLPKEVRPLYKEKLEMALTGKSVRFDHYTSQGNSTIRHWDVVKIPVMDDNSKVVGVHMVARDISEKVLAQEEILEKNKDLQQFTYVVSHNLRSPLTNALGLVKLLEVMKPDSPQFYSSLSHLGTSLRQLDQVVNDMNTILAIRDKESLTPTESVTILGVVNDVVQNFQDALKDCGGNVRIDIPEDVKVKANKAFLYSIFYNLLSNAIKFRSPQRLLQVDVSSSKKGDKKEITFSDNGLGVDLEQAGSEFFKLYKRFHPEHQGRGMGLYLVKTHVESIGGHIEVKSGLNRGTTFKILMQ